MPHPHYGVGQKVMEFVPASASYALTVQNTCSLVPTPSAREKKNSAKLRYIAGGLW